MEKAILSNQQLDQNLLNNGYVVIPFLTTEEVAQLDDFYYQFHPRELDGMYATAHVPDIELRMKMNDFIKTIFARAIGETFVNCQPLGGSYIAKGKGEKGSLQPHQDWNIVDEEQYRSFNIWVPLVDLKEDNGVILILPGSHTWLKSYRSANTPSAYGPATEALWEEMQPLYMKAGEALVYDHRLVHASGENNSDEIRLAAVYGIIPEGADMHYYHKADEAVVEVYESNPDFFLYGNIFEGPKGLKHIKKFHHDFHSVSRQQLYLMMGREPAPELVDEVVLLEKPSFLKKIGRIFQW